MSISDPDIVYFFTQLCAQGVLGHSGKGFLSPPSALIGEESRGMVAGTPRVEDYDVNGDNLPSAGIAETVSMVTWFDRNHRVCIRVRTS